MPIKWTKARRQKRILKKRVIRRRKFARRGALVTRRRGFMLVNRLGPDVFISNSAVGGVPGIYGTNTDSNLQLGTVSSTPGWGYYIPFSMQFTMNQIQNFSEFGNLFDQYKLNKVVVKITYQHNVSTAGGSSGLPELQWRVDYDDATPIGPGAFKELMGSTRRSFTSSRNALYMTVYKPRAMLGVNDTTGLAIGKPVNTYIDIAQPDVPHYGIKGVLSNVLLPADAVNTLTSFKFETRYYFSVANVR